MRKAHLSCNKIDVYLNKAMKFCNNVAIADSVSLKDKTRKYAVSRAKSTLM